MKRALYYLKHVGLALKSLAMAIYETGFTLLPIIVYVLILLSIGKEWDSIKHLPEWSFITIALWGIMLRDSLTSFRQKKSDNILLTTGLIMSITGLVLTTALLTISTLSQNKINLPLLKVYYNYQFIMFICALIQCWFLKTVGFYQALPKPEKILPKPSTAKKTEKKPERKTRASRRQSPSVEEDELEDY
ncbi:hypothetical protein [Spartinivicinus poritis]|uniref:Uncharacterized protein n=1 Tax=Spartinivicinus poritis TaxID=2994640 RepID=A0ABT5UHH1_9GAMM|nr:hypothetical protein [Spartinivicinus sp. A2-2]MDE1465829.1 hypothetical protein [Spartinivicinus sp. A2-2]